MRSLIDSMLDECPDHAVIEKPWRYDIRELRCFGAMGDGGMCIEMEISTHEAYVALRFFGATGISISGDIFSAYSIRIIDASAYPEMPAPIRVEHPNGGGGLSFWAESVELLYKKEAG